jgi:hypothetical protein
MQSLDSPQLGHQHALPLWRSFCVRLERLTFHEFALQHTLDWQHITADNLSKACQQGTSLTVKREDSFAPSCDPTDGGMNVKVIFVVNLVLAC